MKPIADVEVRYCGTCRRDTLQEDTHTCLDGTNYLCTACGSYDVVPTEWVTYSSRPPLRIVSGGQTGADRGGLDAAIALGIPHGGWCPLGRRAEDGMIPARYDLTETESADYPPRTLRNVLDADATVIFTRGRLEGGSRLTADVARQAGKPWMHIDVERIDGAQDELIAALRAWLAEHQVATLNVAGSRESKARGIQEAVARFLEEALRR